MLAGLNCQEFAHKSAGGAPGSALARLGAPLDRGTICRSVSLKPILSRSSILVFTVFKYVGLVGHQVSPDGDAT